MPSPAATATGLLGDTADRDYTAKLQSFNAFVQPQLRQAIASLQLQPGARILDAGCGTGESLPLLLEAAGPSGTVTGIDLATAHIAQARRFETGRIQVLQGDLMRMELPAGPFDLVWSVNTLNHLRDPAAGIARLGSLLRPGGRLAVGQSSFLPDMCFAWDARLERLTNQAVRRHYAARYGLSEADLAAVRRTVGLLLEGGLRHVVARTWVAEALHPLAPAAERYLRETIFRDTFGERLKPWLEATDYQRLRELCDPHHPDFALRRPDFHFLQTLTFTIGTADQR